MNSIRLVNSPVSRLDFKGCKVETIYISDGESEHSRLEGHIVWMTPELAAHWLTFNREDNRDQLKGHTRKLASDVREGRWQHTHQGICFNVLADGSVELADGQHRLQTCIDSGMAIVLEVAVFRNVSVRSPIDVNARRRPDFINGLGTRRHPVARVLLGLQKGFLTFSSNGVSPAAVGECYQNNKETLDAVLEAADTNAAIKSKLVRCPAVAAIAFAYPLNPQAALKFAEKLAGGENITRTDPVYALRAWLVPGLTEKDIAYGTCSAIKATLEGRTLKHIHTGTTPYEWLCSRRRGLRIPNTPRFEKA